MIISERCKKNPPRKRGGLDAVDMWLVLFYFTHCSHEQRLVTGSDGTLIGIERSLLSLSINTLNIIAVLYLYTRLYMQFNL